MSSLTFFDEINRLRPSKLRLYRLKILVEDQFECCQVCSQPIHPNEAVLDHCHSTGRVRSTIHNKCNLLIGKVENLMSRWKISIETIEIVAPAIHKYITKDYSHMPYHPSYRTEEEKRTRRLAKAKVRRQKKKELSGKMGTKP